MYFPLCSYFWMRHVVLYAVLKVAYLISASGHVLLMSLHVLIEFIVSES